MGSRCSSMRLLAKVKSTKLVRCSCGSIHLALPHATLHFDESGLRDLETLVTEGVAAVEASLFEADPRAATLTKGPGRETLQ